VGLWSVLIVDTRSVSRSPLIKSLAWLRLRGGVWLVVLGIEKKNMISNNLLVVIIIIIIIIIIIS
jgi:hypothetical protein